MRAALGLATLVIGLFLTMPSAHASDPQKKESKDAKPPATTKDTKTNSGTGTPAVRGATPAAQGVTPAANGATSTAKGATAAKLETAAAAAAAGARKQGTVTVAATTSAPKEETLEEIVARVKRRLAMESAPKRKVSAPAAPSATPAPRVTLVWRPYVVWPDELTASGTAENQPDADRVTLQWESDEQ